jgi:hypothetical protein
MSDLGPSGNDPDSDLQPDVGADLHEWTTRWEQIEQDREDAPAEALEEAAELLEEMAGALQVPSGEAETPPTEDVPQALTELRDVAGRLGADVPVESDELREAFDEARRTFELLVTGRRASGGDAGL